MKVTDQSRPAAKWCHHYRAPTVIWTGTADDEETLSRRKWGLL